MKFVDKLVEIAKEDLWIRETSHNRGEGISKYWSATTYPTGYANREPWCAAAVCYWIAQAFKGRKKPSYPLPKTPLAFGFCRWARNHGLNYSENPSKVRKGDVVVFRHSHIGIAVEDSRGGYVKTVEANTNADGAREGNGVFEKKRPLSSIKMAITL